MAGCGQTANTPSVDEDPVSEAPTTDEEPMGMPPAVDTGVKKADDSPVMDNFSFFAYQGDDALPHEFHNVESGQTVYMTTDISPEGLMKIYEALGVNLQGKVAVKLSTGENGSNYLDPALIKDPGSVCKRYHRRVQYRLWRKPV